MHIAHRNDRETTHFGAFGVDLGSRTLDAIKGVLNLLDGPVKLLKGEPRLPDHLGPVEILPCDVLEDLTRVGMQTLLAARLHRKLLHGHG